MALSCRPSCRISVLWGVLSAATQYPLILYHTYAAKSRKMFMKAFSKFMSCRVRGCTVCTPPQWGVLSGHRTYCTQEHAQGTQAVLSAVKALTLRKLRSIRRHAVRSAAARLHPILYHIYAGMSILTQQKFYESVFKKKKKKSLPLYYTINLKICQVFCKKIFKMKTFS